MIRKLLAFTGLFAAAFLVTTANAYSQDAQLTNLAYKFTPGDVDHYRVIVRVSGTQTGTGASGPTPINAELTSSVKIKCDTILPDGSAQIEVGTESASLKMDGKLMPDAQLPPARTVRIARNGKIYNMDGRRLSLDFASVESIVFMSILPSQPVKIGALWRDNIPFPKGPKTVIRMGFMLQNISQNAKGRLASIKQLMSTPIAPDVSGRSSAAQQMKQYGQAQVLFDVDSGKLVSMQGSINPMLVAADNGSAVTSSTMIDTSFTVERLAVSGID